MKFKLFKILSFVAFCCLLYWLTTYHNDSKAAAPWSNISTIDIGGSIFVKAGLTTNVWQGATNIIDVRTNHYYFEALTPCAVSGIYDPYSGQYAWNPTLKIKNISPSNITITMLGTIRVPIGDLVSATLTNGDTWIGSFDISDNQTNMMGRMWH